MGLSRRFLNLIVESRIPGVKSLRCIDLTRQHFFNNTTPQPLNGNGSESEEGPQDATSWAPAADAGNLKNTHTTAGASALKMGRIWLPSPSFNFRATTSSVEEDKQMHCFPIGDRRVICADQSGSCFLVDAERRRVVTMPHLHKPKSAPLPLFVPSADPDDHNDGGGILFVMESAPEPEEGCSAQLSHQFEAFVYRKPVSIYYHKSWHCHPLPPPPFVCDRKCRENLPKISSYAVVSGGSHVCISVEGAGSYFLDTASYTWSHERAWTLPFRGKVEYVPELKLWFGFSAKDQSLAAADLTDTDSQPQLVSPWKEFNPHEEWQVSQDPQVVNLGLGRFCIARFFHNRTLNRDCKDEPNEQNCAVLTGVEVVPSRVPEANGNGGNGKVDLHMITHKSRRYMSNGSDGVINTVF
ncbi:unnamed protein product [Urochloa decumbens]|uniref:Uncharacterized protein n=1 Tax=Urochloa decumbens TaxID=240449 RepID=A0ABC9FXL5_9POAL